MLMVVFGAGASHDSFALQSARDYGSQVVKWRPPLAKELFSRPELYQEVENFPDCQPIASRLYALPGGISLEAELERLQGQAEKGDVERVSQLVAVRYYLQYVIFQLQENWKIYTKGVSNYKTLLDQIRRWKLNKREPVSLVTFNYDTLLGEAVWQMLRLPQTTEDFEDYIRTDYKIFKLHGSVIWAREVDTENQEIIEATGTGAPFIIARRVVKHASTLHFNSVYRHAPQRPIATLDGKTALVPAIAIPVHRKQDYECPPAHITALKRLLPRVSHIVIIGWRAREERFVGTIIDLVPKDTRTLIVSSNLESANEIKGFLHAVGYPKQISVAKGGFTEFVLKEQLEEFLSWSGEAELQLD